MPIKTLLVLCVSVGIPAAAAGCVVVLGYDDMTSYVYERALYVLTRTIRIELSFIIFYLYASLCCGMCIRLVL